MDLVNTNYDAIAEQWQTARVKLPPNDAVFFDRFIALLPAKARVLDLGCGNGAVVMKRLVEHGFWVEGVDASKNLLMQAQKRFPKVLLTLADLREYEIKQHYEAIVLWDVLFHLPRADHLALLTSAFNGLKRKGKLIVSSGGSCEDIPPFTDFMFGVEFFYDAFPVEQFKVLCQQVGFNIEYFDYVNKPNGERDKGRIGLILTKP